MDNLFLDLLISAQGDLAFAGDPRVGRQLGLGLTEDSSIVAVRDHGWLRLSRGRLITRVTVGVRQLTKPAFHRLVSLLVERNASLIVVQRPWANPGVEIFNGLDDAVARLRVDSTCDSLVPFVADPLSLAHIDVTPVTRRGFGEVFNLWKVTLGKMTIDVENRLDRPGLGTTIARYKRKAGMTRLVVESFGTHPGFLPAWRQAAIGNDFENQPDERVGYLSAVGCHEFRGSVTPTLELVDARVQFPGMLPQQLRLQRLLLPWRRGADQLFSVSTLYRFAVTVWPDRQNGRTEIASS